MSTNCRCYPCRSGLSVLAAMLLILSVAGCGESGESRQTYLTELDAWVHYGDENERRVIQQQVSRFNDSQPRLRVNAVILPAGSYYRQVSHAIRDGNMPDILELDPALLKNAVEADRLHILDKVMTEGSRRALLPSLVKRGMSGGRLYSVAAIEDGLGLFARKSRLAMADGDPALRIARGWRPEKLETLMAGLAAHDDDGRVMDFRIDHGVRQTQYPVSSPMDGSRSALDWLEQWHRKGYIDDNADRTAFVSGRTVFSIAGNRAYFHYLSALGDDLVVYPLPDFGNNYTTAYDGWSWAISKTADDVRGAVRFLEYLLSPQEVLNMAGSTGAIPGLVTTRSESEYFSDHGAMASLFDQAQSGKVILYDGATEKFLSQEIRDYMQHRASGS